MVALTSWAARSRDVIAALHLDHGPTFDKVVECMNRNCTVSRFRA
jgi:hypothetical protein